MVNRIVVACVTVIGLTGLLAGCAGDGDKPQPTSVITVEGSDPTVPEQTVDVVLSKIVEQVPSASDASSVVDIFNGSPGVPPIVYANIVVKNDALFSQEDFGQVVDIVKTNKPDSGQMVLVVTDASGNPVDLTGFAENVVPGMWETDASTGGVGIILK